MREKPLLIYDGDCGFCKRWIVRWRALTGGRVDYEPYQTAASQYPEIPQENFQKSVQFIEDSTAGRRMTSGAEAVFRSLAYHPGRRWLLWGYENIPGARSLSENFYRRVAENRVFFSKLTQFFWGDRLEPSTYQASSFLFLRILAAVYVIAFFSLSTQVLGLIGSNGIAPVPMLLQEVAARFGAERFWLLPSLTWLSPSNGFLLFLCYAGFILSVLLFFGFLPNLILFLLWFFYLSLVSVGQDFLSFQWDALLLETGFLSIFLAPLVVRESFRHLAEPPAVPRFLLKWLLFRLMFLSGAAKLASHDEAWRTLTALQVHYETQPLPPWTAWYMHHLPAFFHKISALGMFGIELLVPFLFFAPRRLRLWGCWITIIFQLLIMATGNYCFFNWLAIALCVLLLDDVHLSLRGQRSWPWQSGFEMQIASSQKTLLAMTGKGLRSLAMTILAFIVLWVSLGQMSWIWHGGSRRQRTAGWLEQIVSPLRTINSYGLFAIMTTSRYEIIIEGSDDGEEWKAYEFRYKPGDLSKKPEFVQPHQPRLDWQMWFAALNTYQQNPWIINFCIRLLQGEPSVLKLLKKNPFPGKPPKYLRASYYRYHFSTPEEKKTYGVWWRREDKGLYCPVMSLGTQT